MKTINTIDLFCGAGGATTGLELALSRLGMAHKGIAINHWEVAVETMRANHPMVDTRRMSIEEAVPADMVPGGFVDLLWASPSCTHHSRAKGGKPRSNQLRAQPELILTWLDQLMVRRLIVENVPEFVEWGPLNARGEPIKRLKGECFRAWVESIKARNYQVEWRVVNCADYGDATTRRRFFLKAVRKGCGKIRWPDPEYAEDPQPSLFGNAPRRWRGIRECLDLSDTGHSIFDRKKPLAANTMRRIMVGLRKFCGLDFQVDMLGSGEGDDCRLRTLDKPMVTQHAIVRPLVMGQHGGAECRPITEPCPTIATSGAIRVITPLVMDHLKNGKAMPADDPIGAQPTHDRFSMVTPFVMDMSHPGDSRDEARLTDASMPMNTVTTRNNSAAVILPRMEDGRVVDVRIRMLKPSELAAAHSFPKDYVLTGNRCQQVKQIGNSVPVMTAAAMCQADLA